MSRRFRSGLLGDRAAVNQHWIVEVEIEPVVMLPSGERLDRESFHAWLWEHAAGLAGIDEGSMSAEEAAARGLVADPVVIDAAAAPADRDWVVGLAAAACWFGDEPAAREAARLIAGVEGCRVGRVRKEEARDSDEGWREAFGPINVPGFGVVRPAWEEGIAGVGPDGATIFIEPGVGFGTGLHETTQLCLAAFAAWRRGGGGLDRVLDFGSGSGILAIAAAVCGARHVAAVEIDERVHEAIRANADRNGVGQRVSVTAALPVEGEACDLVFANIVAPVLLDHVAALCGRMGRGGGLVLSGLRADDVPEVAERYAALLGAAPEMAARGDWRCLLLERRS
jgi:ribosomal protein L11 methyltransferase